MKSRNKKLLAWMGALLSSPFLLFPLFVYVWLPFSYFLSRQDGYQVIALVEKYKIKHGRLPATLSDIGLEDKMDAPIQYQVEGENEYLVSFSMASVGESITYSSKTKKWNDESP